MPMEILDPRSLPEGSEALHLSPRPAALKGMRIGFLDNGKRNSRRMLEHLAAALREQHGLADAVIVTKPSHSAAAPASIITDLQRRCDLVIAGIGD